MILKFFPTRPVSDIVNTICCKIFAMVMKIRFMYWLNIRCVAGCPTVAVESRIEFIYAMQFYVVLHVAEKVAYICYLDWLSLIAR